MSDCLVYQVNCHGRRSLRIALRMVRSFRATAMSATIFGFPAVTRRSKKAFKAGLCFLATIAPMNTTVRTVVRPPPMKLRPGRRGYFLGCSKYPKCKGTREAPPELLEQVEASSA